MLARSDTAGTNSVLVDALGSTLVLTDAAGAPQTRYDYDPYGQTASGGAPGDNSAQYTGRENDGTGLYFHRARYYDPAKGRFTQTDPIGLDGGINTFIYASDNPVRYTDPLGLWGSDAHNRILASAFSSWGDAALRDIQRGSSSVDSLRNQLGNWSFLHGMREEGQSIEDAKSKACAFIKDRLARYREGANSADPEVRSSAHFALGEALHPVMDSTSPMHRGWQVWRYRDGMNHGNGMGSQEGLRALTMPLLQETLLLINATLEGDPCACTF